MNENRELPVRCETGRRKKLIGFAVAILLFVLLAGGGILLLNQFSNPAQQFIPPPFEETAVAGEPSPPAELGYGMVEAEKGFRFGLCGALQPKGSTVPVYLTNPSDNEVWLQLILLDQQGAVLGTTGVLKPGEWVEALTLTARLPQGEQNVTMKVASYEPETYVSCGAASLSTKLLSQAP